MNLEIGTRIWLEKEGEPLEVVNIRLSSTGQQEPHIYFDDGGDMPASAVFINARAWG